MSHHIKGMSRSQTTLFPEALDDYISEENPIRVIDAYVDQLDLRSLGFNRVVPSSKGRPSYDPATLLKLYLYGYLNRIQSSRRLEKESQRNVELMWLIERLTPDFKTIADFRKDNGKGIKNACKTFIALCRNLNMFNDTVVAIDGSKFKASNSKRNNHSRGKVKYHTERVEQHICHYLEKLDAVDIEESPEKAQPIKEKLDSLKQELVRLKAMEEDINSHPDKQISLTDPDSRLMLTQKPIRAVCYNVQAAVDTKHHLIVSHEVTNIPDRGQLHMMTQKTQEALGDDLSTVLADKGYYSRVDIKATQDLGVDVLVPKSDTSGSDKKGIFNKKQFKYEPEHDRYECPNGYYLTFRTIRIEDGLEQKVYGNFLACRDCEIRSQCTTSKTAPRKLRRWVHQEAIDKMDEAMLKQPETILLRKQTVEHPFGTIKMWMGAQHFLTRRLKNVSTEMSLHVLAYNLRRMMSIFGVKQLIRAITA